MAVGRIAGLVLLGGLTAALLFGCKERRGRPSGGGMAGASVGADAAASTDADSLWRVVMAAQVWPNTFSANYQLGFSGLKDGAASKGGLRVSGQWRLSADGVLWLTGGLFGLEAFRAWVTQDSLVVLNRMEGKADIYALAVWRERLSLPLTAVGDARRFVTAVLLGLIPDELQAAEVCYMERRPAAEGGAEALRFGLLPAVGKGGLWPGLLVCDVTLDGFHLQALYGLLPETMGFTQPLSTVGTALPAAAAAALDAAPLRLLYPSPDSRRLSWRDAGGKGVDVQLTYSKVKMNEPVEVSTDLPKKYAVRYVE